MKKSIKSYFFAPLICIAFALLSAKTFAQSADFTADRISVCEGETVIFSDASTGFLTIPTSFEWNFGEGSTPSSGIGQGPHSVRYSGEGQSTVVLKVVLSNSTYTETKTDFISRRPETTLSLTSNNNNQIVCLDPIKNITYTLSGSNTQPTIEGLPEGIKSSLDNNIFSLFGTPSDIEGVYNYTITTTGPCSNHTAQGIITISNNPNDCNEINADNIDLPSLITPNGDGINDYFEIRGYYKPKGAVEIIIFDRRGLQVFKDTNYQNNWNGVDQNGNPLPEDTYYYSIKNVLDKALSGYIVIRR